MARRLALALLVLAATSGVRGDVVYLANGQRLEGEITSETADRVMLRTSSGSFALPRSTIDRIQRVAGDKTALLRARQHLRAGRIAGGMDALLSAAQSRASAAELNAVLEDSYGALLKAAAKSEGTDRQDAKAECLLVQKADFLTSESHCLLAQVFVALEAPDAATTSLDAAGLRVMRATPARAEWVAYFLKEDIRRLITLGEFDRALAQAARLRSLQGETEIDQTPLVYLARSADARERGDFATALDLLRDQVLPVAPEIARNRVRLTLDRCVTAAVAEHSEGEARRIVEQSIGDTFPAEADEARQKLLSSEINYALDCNRTSEAMALAEVVPEAGRSAELQAAWKRAEFESRMASVAPEDPLALFQVARWCIDQELYEEARLILGRVRGNPTLQNLAQAQARLLDSQVETRQLQQAVTLYEQGQYQETMDAVARIVGAKSGDPAIAREASRLGDLARREVGNRQLLRPFQAEALFQEAERAYFREDLEASARLIDAILTSYAETPAAGRASALLPSIVRSHELRLLEGKPSRLPQLTAPARTTPEDDLATEVEALLSASRPKPVVPPAGS